MNEQTAQVEMPRYRCHKEVWALKIKEIRHVGYPKFSGAVCRGTVIPSTGCGKCEKCEWEKEHHSNPVSAHIITEEPGYAPIPVTSEYIRKHKPSAGGYYVVYKDGYKSFSPADAFEEGYTRI